VTDLSKKVLERARFRDVTRDEQRENRQRDDNSA
jgi:hypothetical protein